MKKIKHITYFILNVIVIIVFLSLAVVAELIRINFVYLFDWRLNVVTNNSRFSDITYEFIIELKRIYKIAFKGGET